MNGAKLINSIVSFKSTKNTISYGQNNEFKQ